MAAEPVNGPISYGRSGPRSTAEEDVRPGRRRTSAHLARERGPFRYYAGMRSHGSPGGALHHVSLRVADLERSIAFYREGLGLTLGSAFELRGRRYALMVAPRGGRVELIESREVARLPSESDVLWHFALETDDAQAALDAAVAAGGEVTVPLTALDLIDEVAGRPFRVRLAFVRGPDAEEVELIEELDG